MDEINAQDNLASKESETEQCPSWPPFWLAQWLAANSGRGCAPVEEAGCPAQQPVASTDPQDCVAAAEVSPEPRPETRVPARPALSRQEFLSRRNEGRQQQRIHDKTRSDD